MQTKPEKESGNSKEKQLSRRDFLKAGGAVIASAVLFNSFAACSKTTTATTTASTATTVSTPKYGGIFKWINTAMGPTFGWPPDLSASPNVTFTALCLEGLLHENYSGELVPCLAESYKIADDLKSVTFNLRKGVKFHDGSDFNAQVAKWNLDNSITAKVFPYWTSVDVIDDYTVRVNFSTWQNNLVSDFGSNGATFMISKAAFDKNGIDWVKMNPIGTGPFKFVSLQRDVNFNTVRNPDYWGKDEQGNQLPYLDRVESTFISEPETARMVMMAREDDMVGFTDFKSAADMRDLGFNVKLVLADTWALMPDTAHADSPWANQQVREAAEYAIDRETISNAFGHGLTKAAYQIGGRDSVIYNPNFALARKYDPAKAKQLLAEAGHPDGFKTTIITNPQAEKDVVTAVQNYLTAVNIVADVQYLEMAAFVPDVWFGSWHNGLVYLTFPSFPNYNFVLNWWFAGGIMFKSWLQTPEYLQAYKASSSSPAPDVNLMRAVTDTWAKQASLIPILEGGSGMISATYVMGARVGTRRVPVITAETIWLNK